MDNGGALLQRPGVAEPGAEELGVHLAGVREVVVEGAGGPGDVE